MDGPALAVYASALLMAGATPGPGIAAIVARVLGRGVGGALPLASGLALGDLIWLSTGVWGLAALARTFGGLMLVIKWGGILYLVYLAWRMWTAAVVERDVTADTRAESAPALFMTGLAVCLGNPKVMAFYWALVPTLVDVARITVADWLALVGVTLSCLVIVFGSYILLAARARLIFKQGDAMRAVNRVAAVAIGVTAIWMALR